jgi:RNA polymerase sigma factor (sigma-70 family)
MLNWRRRKRLSLDELESAFVRAQEGYEESKEAVFGFLRSRLLVLAKYRVPEIAEDTVHESLVVVHSRFSEFKTVEGLLAFTNQVLRNKIGNVYQGRSRQKHVELEDEEMPYRIDGDLEAVELDRIVRESIDKLGESRPACQAILRCLYQGLEPDEISDQLGISKSKLKVRTFRCREALRDILHREYQWHV